MMVRMAGFALPGAAEVVGTVRAVADRTGALIGVATGLPRRIERLLTDVEALVAQIARVAEQAAGVVARTEITAAAAQQTVATARSTAELANSLLARFVPLLERAEPMAKRFVDELSPEEVTSAIRLVDLLPELTGYMERGVLPILATMDRVGPDIHELLEVSKDVRHAIHGIPGFRFFERRGANQTHTRRS